MGGNSRGGQNTTMARELTVFILPYWCGFSEYSGPIVSVSTKVRTDGSVSREGVIPGVVENGHTPAPPSLRQRGRVLYSMSDSLSLVLGDDLFVDVQLAAELRVHEVFHGQNLVEGFLVEQALLQN